MENKKVLITGGAGFIGSNMAAYQLNQGNDVWVVDNLVTGRMSNLECFLTNSHFRFDQADVLNWPKILEAVKWADVIFHLAASVGQRFVLSNPIFTITNNIQTLEEILKAMNKVNHEAKLLVASSSEVYCHSKEDQEGRVSENVELILNTDNILQDTYPVSKLTNEIMALSYVHEKNFHCTVARLFNTIGINQTGDYGMVVPTFIEEAIHNKPITVYGDGLQTRSFADVRDVVTALDMLVSTSKSKGEIVNVGNDEELKIIELAELVKKKANSQSKISYMSYEQAYGTKFNDVRRRRPDLRKLKSLTGFNNKYNLANTIEYILEHIHTQAF